MVDMIIVMENGRIIETGSYEELLQNKSAFSLFLHDHLQHNNGNEEDQEGMLRRNLQSWRL